MADSESEELNYVSSVDPFTPDKSDPSVDAPDERALVTIQRMLTGEIKRYHTISGVKQFDKNLTLEQRFELCDQYTKLLGNLSLLVNNAIDGIKKAE